MSRDSVSFGGDANLARIIERICDDFSKAWSAGDAPKIEDYLKNAPEAAQLRLLRELLHLELEQLSKQGDKPGKHDYIRRFPSATDIVERVYDELASGTSTSREDADETEGFDVDALQTRSVQPDVVPGSLPGDAVTSRADHARPPSVPCPETGDSAATRTQQPLDNTAESPQGQEGPALGTARLGRYELFEEIASGGNGVVLRARDHLLGREVAVKVISKRHGDNEDARQRFFNEAQVTGQLQHPGIVPVYDVGELDGRPFLAMKLVKGKTLAELLRDRSDPGQDRPHFLRIFQQVCQTTAYAHARHVIHRDLKPSNIMVGAFGEVQVMDWGLAKVISDEATGPSPKSSRTEMTRIRTIRQPSSGSSIPTEETQDGSVLGTPAYMPPEQALGEVKRLDERTDVFALGAILFHILTGRPPYVGDSQTAILHMARRHKLHDAFALLDRYDVDGDLTRLTRQCLVDEPGERPPDAGAVAVQLSAYLESVENRLREAELVGARAGAKAQEERKRRRVTVALAASVLAIVMILGSGWVWLAEKRADWNRRANDAAVEAELSWEQARFAPLDERLLARATSAVQRARLVIDAGPARDKLQNRLRRLERDVGRARRDQQVVEQLDRAWMAEGEVEILESRFDPFAALPRYDQAFAEYGFTAGASAAEEVVAILLQRPVEVHDRLVAGLDRWLSLLLAKHDNRSRWVRQVLRGIDPDPYRERLRSAGDSDGVAALLALAESDDLADQPATVFVSLADRLRARQESQVAIAVLSSGQRRYPADFAINRKIGYLLQNGDPPRHERAIRYLAAALAVRQNAGVYVNYGLCLAETGQVEESIAALRRAIDLQPNYAQAHINLGLALMQKGELDAAVQALDKAARLQPDDANAHSNLGLAFWKQRQLDRAALHLRRVIELKPDQPRYYVNLGVVLLEMGDVESAKEQYRHALQLDPEHVEAHNNLGLQLLSTDLDAAIEHFEHAVAAAPELAISHFHLGLALQKRNELGRAIQQHRKSLELRPDYAPTHFHLGSALAATGDYEAAERHYRKAIEVAGDTEPRNEIARVHYNLGNVLRLKNQLNEAMQHFATATQLAPDYAEAHCNLGRALQLQGRFIESLDSLRRGHQLGSGRPGWKYPSAAWVKEAEDLVRLDAKLDAVRQGDERPDRELARFCLEFKQQYDAAARYYEQAFDADPGRTTKSGPTWRFRAAQAAALAGAGKGRDAGELTNQARARWRVQAVAWLRAGLAILKRRIEAGSAEDARKIADSLRDWLLAPSLAEIRDYEQLLRLPREEREACQQLWSDVLDLQGRVPAAP